MAGQGKAASGDLTGTLTPEGALSLMDAAQQQIAQGLSQQTQQAANQAQGAQQAYQGAAQAPMPGFLPGDSFIPLLLGSLASVIGQSPTFEQQAQHSVEDQRAALAKQRADNLAALRDNWLQKAKEAADAGDRETEIKARNQFEKTAKQFDLANSDADRQNRMAMEQLRSKTDLEIARINADARQAAADRQAAVEQGDDDFYRSFVITTGIGNQVLDISKFNPKERSFALKWAAKNGIKAANDRTVAKLQDLDSARQNLSLMLANMDFLPDSPGERAIKGPLNWAAGIAQTNPSISAFRTFRIAAIQQIKALAGGVGSGLRINQAEIAQAVANDIPTITDTKDTAREKLARVLALLDRAEAPFATNTYKPSPQIKGGVNEPAASSKVRMRGTDGKPYLVDKSEVDQAKANGWTVIQ